MRREHTGSCLGARLLAGCEECSIAAMVHSSEVTRNNLKSFAIEKFKENGEEGGGEVTQTCWFMNGLLDRTAREKESHVGG
jgi:hypothetical protein